MNQQDLYYKFQELFEAEYTIESLSFPRVSQEEIEMGLGQEQFDMAVEDSERLQREISEFLTSKGIEGDLVL